MPNSKIKVGSIVEWTGSTRPDIGVVLKIGIDVFADDGKSYNVYWFADKRAIEGHIGKHLEVIVP